MINVSNSFLDKIIKIIFLLLIISWIIISSYLTYSHFSDSSVYCAPEIKWNYLDSLYDWSLTIINWNNCDSVLKSNYSKIFGIPTAIFGIIFYITTLIIYLLFSFRKEIILNKILFGFTLIWLLFSTYFSYLQLFVINSFCAYCFTSAIITLVLFILSIYLIKNKKYVTK